MRLLTRHELQGRAPGEQQIDRRKPTGGQAEPEARGPQSSRRLVRCRAVSAADRVGPCHLEPVDFDPLREQLDQA